MLFLPFQRESIEKFRPVLPGHQVAPAKQGLCDNEGIEILSLPPHPACAYHPTLSHFAAGPPAHRQGRTPPDFRLLVVPRHLLPESLEEHRFTSLTLPTTCCVCARIPSNRQL